MDRVPVRPGGESETSAVLARRRTVMRAVVLFTVAGFVSMLFVLFSPRAAPVALVAMGSGALTVFLVIMKSSPLTTANDPQEIVRRALARGEAVTDARYAAEAIATAERHARSLFWKRIVFALIVSSYPVAECGSRGP